MSTQETSREDELFGQATNSTHRGSLQPACWNAASGHNLHKSVRKHSCQLYNSNNWMCMIKNSCRLLIIAFSMQAGVEAHTTGSSAALLQALVRIGMLSCTWLNGPLIEKPCGPSNKVGLSGQ